MLEKLIIALFVTVVLSSCVHTPFYYASLEKITYKEGKAIFSDNIFNDKTQYGALVLREDGACSITEMLNGRVFRGGGTWKKTDHPNIISVGLSSNSPMTIYHFYVRLNKESENYVVSDNKESLIEL